MSDNEAFILGEIQDNYVPFLKKLIAYLEKNKKITDGNLNRLKTIYTVFTTSSISEQIQVFNVNKKRLEKWYKSQKKDNMTDNSEERSTQTSKRTFEEDTDSSQRTTVAEPTKRSRSGSSSSADKATSDPAVVTQIAEEKALKAAAIPTTPAVANNMPSNANENVDILYSCASCQFQSHDEQDFMKHIKTEHRSDASMWCKQCDKCFSNALLLVSHIKEKACLRDEMIYRCGVKECTYETTSGQIFVYHLRNTHRGNPFIYCVHCQKFYTVPQCLVLHMQDECLYKERNRRNLDAEPTAPKP